MPKLSLTQRVAIVGGLTSSLIAGGCLLGDIAAEGLNFAAGTQINPQDAKILRAGSRVVGRASQRHENTRVKYENANVDIYRDRGLSQTRIAEERVLMNLEDELYDSPTDSTFSNTNETVEIHYFYASWARPCEKQYKILGTLKERYPNLVINYYNVDDRQNRAIVRKMKPTAVPTIVFSGSNKALIGLTSIKDLEREIKRHSYTSKKSKEESKEKEKNQSKFIRFFHKIDGDEIIVKAHIQNPSDETEEYRLFLYDKNNKLLDKEPDIYWLNIDSNETNTLVVSTDLENILDNSMLAEVKTQKGKIITRKRLMLTQK